MAETKFTPGPWQMSGVRSKRNVYGHTVGPDSDPIITVDYSDRTPDLHSETLGNAHLIAAAPELYAALEDMIALYINTAGNYFEPGKVKQMIASLAALAKARGET